MKFNLLVLTSFLLVLSTSSVSFASDSGSVDCSTAKEDIAHLKHEKKSTDERVIKGVVSILPIAIVVNVAHGVATQDSAKEMEINKYNQKISERITEIQQKCNVQ
jgi:hypothetical protein